MESRGDQLKPPMHVINGGVVGVGVPLAAVDGAGIGPQGRAGADARRAGEKIPRFRVGAGPTRGHLKMGVGHNIGSHAPITTRHPWATMQSTSDVK